MFDFYFNTRIKFGNRSSLSIPEVLATESWTRVGILVDENIFGVDRVTELLVKIENVCTKMILNKCSMPEPSYNYLDQMRQDFMNQGLEAVIGIGGGSTLDIAKAVAVLVHNKEPAIKYRGFNMMSGPVLPIIAVPTTGGTGSEATPNASFVDTVEKRKMGINGEKVRPRYAFIDPELTLSCPLNPTISAGVDSIVHAVEAYVARKSNPMARLLAGEGFKSVFTHLPLLANNLQNLIYREKVMYGALLSGMALMNSGTGPAAAMSYPLGVHHGVPHGIGGGVFLPYVVKHNVSQGCWIYADLYDLVRGGGNSLTDGEKASLFVEEMFKTWEALRVPADLNSFNIQQGDIPRFVKETLELKGALEQNPVPFAGEEILSILQEMKAGA